MDQSPMINQMHSRIERRKTERNQPVLTWCKLAVPHSIDSGGPFLGVCKATRKSLLILFAPMLLEKRIISCDTYCPKQSTKPASFQFCLQKLEWVGAGAFFFLMSRAIVTSVPLFCSSSESDLILSVCELSRLYD